MIWNTKAPAILVAFATTSWHAVEAGRIKCVDSSACASATRPGPGSDCIDGYCSNPLEQGCLRTLLGANFSKRVCNSDDPDDTAERGICDPSPFGYDEIRIENQNWDGPMLSAWIMQILLSELLQVPTTIETNDPDRKYNFYDPEEHADSSTASYSYENLRLSRDMGGDCKKVKEENEETGVYRGCSHVMPMVFKIGQEDNIQKLRDDQIVDQKDAGNSDQYRWWIPLKLAKLNPNLQSYHGIGGESNRALLASLFLRPTTWGDYCMIVSPNNCTVDDKIAARAPSPDDNAESYFVDGLYKGHFRSTEKNDCKAHPTTCTGHIVNVPCVWGTYAIPQAFHLNISVESDGYLEPNGGYNYSSVLEIYSAANATRSNVLLYWWEPDSLIERYRGTEYEFRPIYLPPPTTKCVNNRVTEDQRCKPANFSDQVGSPEGSCDAGPEREAILTAIDECEEDEETSCSPAKAALNDYQLTNLDLQQIFEYRSNDINNDGRASVCKWFAENLDDIKQTFIPNGYPRQRRKESFYQPLIWFTLTLGTISCLCVLLCVVGSKLYEKTKVMVYAQVDFLLIILSGLLLVSMSAVLHSISPTKAVCVSRQWLSLVGYSLELIPLALKVKAINQLFHQSKKMKRAVISKNQLYTQVGAGILVVCIYLAVWTALDPPEPHTKRTLTNDSEDGYYIEEVSSVCSSSSDWWKIASFVYLLILLIITAAIATQNRHIRQEFNESRCMILMLYSHGMFMIMKLVAFLFQDQRINAYAASATVSLLLSLDILMTLAIYFAPKLARARKAHDESNWRRPALERSRPLRKFVPVESSKSQEHDLRENSITQGAFGSGQEQPAHNEDCIKENNIEQGVFGSNKEQPSNEDGVKESSSEQSAIGKNQGQTVNETGGTENSTQQAIDRSTVFSGSHRRTGRRTLPNFLNRSTVFLGNHRRTGRRTLPNFLNRRSSFVWHVESSDEGQEESSDAEHQVNVTLSRDIEHVEFEEGEEDDHLLEKYYAS